MVSSSWWSARRHVPHATGRVVCVPYAGGGASVYRAWHGVCGPTVEVCPVELPGRGTRFGERPYRRLAPLVHDLADAMEPLLDLPYVLYGHSMGGLVVFELARLLQRRRWPAPRHVVVGASPDPCRAREERWHDATDEGLRARLRQLGGTPAELLDDDDLMTLVMPVIRADFEVVETYAYAPDPTLVAPLTVLGGLRDRMVPPAHLDGWRAHARQVRLELLPEAHFFVDDLAPRVASLLAPSPGGWPPPPTTSGGTR